MRLSQRISSVSASATIAVAARCRELQSQGIDVVDFGAGEPDFDTPPFIVEAAKAALNAGDTRYVPRQGAALRKAIAEKLARENRLKYRPEQIVVTFGGKHALYDAFQVLLDPGQEVLIPSPYWTSYPEQAKLAGGVPVFLKTRPEDGFKVTPRQILQAAGRAGILVLNYPSNPTGVCYTPQELKDLSQAILKTDLIVFSDEIYERLIYDDTKFVSFASLDGRLMERTITFNGLAKTFSMTGWRLGWAAGPKEVIDAMACLKSHETTDPVSFAQAGALAAYTSPEAPKAIETMRQEFQKRRDRMAQRLNALPGVRCVQPTGAFYCFPDVSAHYGRTLGGIPVTGSLSFSRAALEMAKVALVPGEAFGEDRCVRLSFATSLAQIDKGLDRLERMLT